MYAFYLYVVLIWVSQYTHFSELINFLLQHLVFLTAHRKGVPGIPPNHGHFLMHFLNLRTGKVNKVKLNSNSYRNFVEMDGLQVDWDGGNILVKKGDGDIAQRICLAFVTSTLYLLVQPRPEDIEEAEQSWIKYKTFTSKTDRSLF